MVITFVLSFFTKRNYYYYYVVCGFFTITKMILANPKTNAWVIANLPIKESLVNTYFCFVDSVYVIFFLLFILHFAGLFKEQKQLKMKKHKSFLYGLLLINTLIVFVLHYSGNQKYIVPFQVYVVLMFIAVYGIYLTYLALREITLFKILLLIGVFVSTLSMLYTLAIIGNDPNIYLTREPVLFYYVGLIILDIFIALSSAVKYRDNVLTIEAYESNIREIIFKQELNKLNSTLNTEVNERKALANKLSISVAKDVTNSITLLNESKQKELQPVIKKLKQTSNAIDQEIDDLYPELILEEDFIGSLEYLCLQYEDFDVEVIDREVDVVPNEKTMYIFYRVAKEIFEHLIPKSKAKQGRIILGGVEGYFSMLFVEVGENLEPIDFDTPQINDMRRRFEGVGGQILYGQEPNFGARVEILLPKTIFQNF